MGAHQRGREVHHCESDQCSSSTAPSYCYRNPRNVAEMRTSPRALMELLLRCLLLLFCGPRQHLLQEEQEVAVVHRQTQRWCYCRRNQEKNSSPLDTHAEVHRCQNDQTDFCDSSLLIGSRTLSFACVLCSDTKEHWSEFRIFVHVWSELILTNGL